MFTKNPTREKSMKVRVTQRALEPPKREGERVDERRDFKETRRRREDKF